MANLNLTPSSDQLDRNNQPINNGPSLRLNPGGPSTVPSIATSSRKIDSGLNVDYGTVGKDIFAEGNIEAQLEQTQSGWQTARNALLQAAGEVGLGTLEGASYLLDLEQHANIVSDTEQEYTNWFAELMKKGKESINEAAPVYRTEEAQTGFAPFDGTWWASNASSLASTLSLMIPAGAATRAVSGLGTLMRGVAAGTRFANTGRKASQVVKAGNKLLYGSAASNTTKGVSSAVFSRYMENTMEASENYQRVLQEGIAGGMSPEEAQQKAGIAAANTWKADSANLLFDLMQYTTLSKGKSIANYASKEFRKNVAGELKDVASTMLQEAAEEGIQFTVSAEARDAALNDRSFIDLSDFGTRMSEYMKDPEMHASLLLGAAGGGVFSASGSLWRKVAGINNTTDADLAKIRAFDNADITTAHKIHGAILGQAVYEHAKAGKLNDYRQFYEEMASATDEDLRAQGMSDEAIAEKREIDKQVLEDIEHLGKEYVRIYDDASKKQADKDVEFTTFYEKRMLSRANDAILKNYEKVRTEMAKDGLSQEEITIKTAKEKLKAYQMYKDAYESSKKHTGKMGSAKVINRIDFRIAQLTEQIEEVSKAVKETEGYDDTVSFDDIPPSSHDAEHVMTVVDEVRNDVNRMEVDRVLSNTETEAGREEIRKEVETAKKEAKINNITDTTSVKDLNELYNDKDAKKKIDSLAEEAEEAAPVPSGEKTREQIKERYVNTPLLHKDLNTIKETGVDTSKVTDAESFANTYNNNEEFRNAADAIYREKLETVEGDQRDTAQAPSQKEMENVLNDEPVDGETSETDTVYDEVDEISDEEYKDFVDNGNISPQRIETIATKIFTAISLNKRETAIYQHASQQIEDKIADYHSTASKNTGKSKDDYHATVQTNENAWYTYNLETGIVTIKGVRGIKNIPIGEAQESYNILNTGGPHVLYTINGEIVKSDMNTVESVNGEIVDLMSEVDFEFINDPDSPLYDAEVNFEVVPTAVYSPEKGADEMLVIISTQHEGEKRVLGMLRSTKIPENTESYEKAKALRERLYNEYQKTGDITSSITSTVTDRTPGKHNYGTNKEQAPHTVLNNKDPFLLGVVDTNKQSGAVEIRIAKGDVKGNNIRSVLDNAGITSLHQLRWRKHSALKKMKGAVVMFLRMADGTYSPTKLYTAKLKELEKETAAVKNDIQKAYHDINMNGADVNTIMKALNESLSNRIYAQLIYDPLTKGFKLEERDEIGNIVHTEPIEIDPLMESLIEKPMRVRLDKINDGNYNKQISEKGWIRTQVSPDRKSLSSNVRIDLDAQGSKAITEEQVKEQSEPDVTNDILDFSNTRSNIRTRLAESDVDGYEKWDRAQEETWFRTNFPDVPFTVLDDLRSIHNKGGVDAWGLFKNSSVYVKSSAAKGAAYHEAFHAMFNLILNDKERANILRDGEHLAENHEAIEEYYADRFMEYMLTEGQIVEEGLSNKVKGLFKRLWNLINIAAERLGLTGPATMEDYFYRASKGLYRPFGKSKFTKNVERFRVSDNRSLEQLTLREEPLAIGMVNANLITTVIPKFRQYFIHEKGIADAIDWNDETLMSRTVAEGLRTGHPQFSITGMYKAVMGVINNELQATEDDVTKDQLQRTLNSFVDETGNFKPIFNKTVNSLWYSGIKVSHVKDTVSSTDNALSDEQLFETDEENTALENWQVKEKFLSSKEKFSQRANALMALVPSDNTFAGMTVFERSSHVFNTLSKELSDSVSTSDMMDKLNNILRVHPNYKVIYDRLVEDNRLRTEFWINMGQRHLTNFMIQLMRRDGKTSVFSANRRNVSRDIIGTWQTSIYGSDAYDSKEQKMQVKNLDKHIAKLSDLTQTYSEKIAKRPDVHVEPKDIDTVARVLKDLKLPIARSTLTRMFGKPHPDTKGGAERLLSGFIGGSKGNRGLLDVLNKMSNGSDPFQDSSSKDMMNALNTIADQIADATPEIYQRTFMNSDGKKIYSILQSRFMFRHLLNMKQSDTANRNDYFNTYLADPFYKDSPFLRDMQTWRSVRDKVHFSVFDGLKQEGFTRGTEYSALTRPELEALKINAWFNTQPDESVENDWGYYMMPILADSSSAAFIHYKKQSIEDVENALVETAKQEKARIDHLNGLSDDSTVPDNMKKNGKRYQIFTFLNDKKVTDLSRSVKAGMKVLVQEEIDRLIDDGIIKRDPKTSALIDNTGMIDGRFDITERVHEYVYNQLYMNIQNFINFAGDPAYYKSKNGMTDVVDTFKRVKEIWSPGDFINVDENNYFIDINNDKISVNPTYNVAYVEDPGDVSKIRSEHMEIIEKIFPGEDNAWIRDKYAELNNTDAATWIDPIRLREIYIGTGRWTNSHQRLFDKVMRGEKIPSNAAIIFNPAKPFIFTHREVDGKIVPTQHKNAEFLLTPDMGIDNPEMRKVLEKMGYVFTEDSFSYDPNKRITDAVMFTSAVKVGKYNAVTSIDDISSEKVHAMDNNEYRIQMATPEHHVDADILFGTQVRKLIVEGIDLKKKYNVPGMEKPISGAELFMQYQEAIQKNLTESYDKVMSMFYDENGKVDRKKMLDVLRQEVIERELGDDMLEALEEISATETVLPLWHPHIAYRVESLLNSFFKNNVTKQTINGMALYNSPSYGLSEQEKPKIIFDETTRAIKYFEVIMPAHSRRMIRRYADSNGLIDVNKVPEDLKKGIFYRIPTEGKYSMFHIKVKSYLPSYAGGQIIMPDEVTTIAGLDFDIDKVYGMLYNMTLGDGKPLADEYAKWMEHDRTPQVTRSGEQIVKADIEDYDAERGRIEYARKKGIEWDTEGNTFREKKPVVKLPSGMETKESRDNLMIDIMWAILSHPDTSAKQLRPGGFESLKTMKDNVLKMENVSESEGLNIMSMNTSREIFERNMTGKNLIGIFANHNANHALMQYRNIQLRKAIDFNGVEYRSLSKEKGETGNSISESLAEFLAASVDNAKEPLASFLNITTTTADAIAAMVRVGHDMDAVLAYIASPPVKEFSKRLALENSPSKRNIKKVISEMKAQITENVSNIETFFESKDDIDLSYESDGTGTIRELYRLKDSELKKLSDPQLLLQWKAIDTLSNVLDAAEALSIVQSGMRYDSINNAAGPTVAVTQGRNRLFKNAYENQMITGFDKFIENSNVPYVRAFGKLGIEAAVDTVTEVAGLPYGSENDVLFKNITDSFIQYAGKLTPTEEDNVYRHIMTLLGTGYKTYLRSRMQDILRTLPDRISKYQQNNPDSDHNVFLNHFNTSPASIAVPFPVLTFNRQGVDNIQQQDIRNIWNSMLYSENAEESDIAKDLAAYSFFMTGYTFGNNTFSDLVPVRYISEMHDNPDRSYTEYLSDMFRKTDWTHNTMYGMIDQIVRNTYQKAPYVPLVDTSSEDVVVTKTDGTLTVSMSPELIYDPISEEDDVPLKYIKIRVKEGVESTRMVLLKRSPVDNMSDDTVTYNELRPLGHPNMFLEYSLTDIANNRSTDSIFDSERKKLIEQDPNNRPVPTDRREIAAELVNVLEKLKGETGYEKLRNLDSTRAYVARLLKVSDIYSLKDITDAASSLANEAGVEELEKYDFTQISEKEVKEDDENNNCNIVSI